MLTPEEINKSNQEKFQHKYTVENVSIKTAVDHNDYFYKLVKVRITYLKEYCLGKKVLDIGCGSGDYLFEIKGMIADGCGIDYTDKAIEAACSKKGLNLVENLKFIKADAQKMPFEDGSFDLVYSFSTLSSIPDLGRIIKEVERVLKPEGLAILEIGNRLSLNTFVCDAHPELAKQTHVRISDMRKMLDLSRMSLVDQRAFGILPFWADKPAWLKPLLHERWKKIFQIELKGKMLDEWVSNFFLFKPFAYRHFLFVRKQS